MEQSQRICFALDVVGSKSGACLRLALRDKITGDVARPFVRRVGREGLEEWSAVSGVP